MSRGTSVWRNNSTNALDALLEKANQGDAGVLAWLRRIERYGATEQLGVDLKKSMGKMVVAARPVFDPAAGWLNPRFEIPARVPEQAAIALVIAQALSDGRLDGLMRCQLEECSRYFVGAGRAKWCSSRCGTRHRARVKRKKDKEGLVT